MRYDASDAELSDCGLYRYRLTRAWDHDGSDTWQPDGGRAVVFLMLNPSTADGRKDDPTIRRCVGFARRWGFGRLVVVNLFAFRATDPSDMLRSDDPIGPHNDVWIRRETAGRVVVLAWGSRSLTVPKSVAPLYCPGRLDALQNRPRDVGRICRDSGAELKCLGLTSDGQPRHPLYVRGDAELIDFRGRKTGC